MATAPPLLSIDEYLHTSYKPDVHFVDGEIEERNVGEQTHSIIQGFLHFIFMSNQEAWQLEPLVEQRIRIHSNQVRVCDIAFTPVEAPFEEVLLRPPFLCVEVLSPEDRISRAEIVLADYFAMGVPNIWLIDPMRRSAYTYGAGGLRLADINNLVIEGTPVHVNLTPAFERIDRKKLPHGEVQG